MPEGCVPGMSRVRWISITSGRSLDRLIAEDGILARDPASWRSRARGKVERSESSRSIPSSSEEIDDPDAAEDLRLRFVGREEGCAHSGTGFSRSNCLRNRFVYSLPLTISSLSFTRSFRSRLFPASDTTNRSSSLSSQAGPSPPSSDTDPARGIKAVEPIADGPESRKKS